MERALYVLRTIYPHSNALAPIQTRKLIVRGEIRLSLVKASLKATK